SKLLEREVPHTRLDVWLAAADFWNVARAAFADRTSILTAQAQVAAVEREALRLEIVERVSQRPFVDTRPDSPSRASVQPLLCRAVSLQGLPQQRLIVLERHGNSGELCRNRFQNGRVRRFGTRRKRYRRIAGKCR